MKDEVLNKYIESLLQERIDVNEVELYIDMFSRFMGYTNPDYKYNGTYLSQYIEDFIEFYRKINEKNKKYIEISNALVNLKYDFELLIDQSFAAIKSSQGLRYEYIGLNRKKIITPGVDIRIVIKCDENEFIFSKQYKDMKDTKYAEIIWEDVKQYTDVKEKKEANNET